MSLVHIIGAGPAGSIAALSALKYGHKVIISEEHEEIGIPTHCSGLFSKEGLLSLKEFVDYKKLVINPIHGAVMDFVGEKIVVRQESPVAYVCSRSGLDQELVNNAVNQGAELETGSRISQITQLKSDIVIGADGPFSAVAKMFDFPKIKKYATTLQGFFKYKSEYKDCVEVYLSKDKFPGFFGWIIPHNEEIAEIGVGVSLPNNIAKAWNHMLKISGVDQNECKPNGAVIPIRVRARTGIKKLKYKICLVGDAAGVTKSTTGGGVIMGGNCARYAGKHCENPLMYEFEWRIKFGLDLFVHKNIQGYLESISDKQIRELGVMMRNMKLDEYLSNHGHMDRPTKMIKPISIMGHLLGINTYKARI